MFHFYYQWNRVQWDRWTFCRCCQFSSTSSTWIRPFVFLRTCWMAKLEGKQRGHPPTTGGNPKYFFLLFLFRESFLHLLSVLRNFYSMWLFQFFKVIKWSTSARQSTIRTDVTSGECEWIDDDVIPSSTTMPTHMMTSQLLSLRCASQSSSLLLRSKVGSSNIEL